MAKFTVRQRPDATPLGEGVARFPEYPHAEAARATLMSGLYATMGADHPDIAAAIKAGLLAKPELNHHLEQDRSKWEFVYTLGEATEDKNGSSVRFAVFAQPTGPLPRPGINR
ncbi:hypothetical protein HMI49_04015 [Corallococcus exercitus]|uniref:Uncharacterized protein n=1 Tax=Corallococcus exercitus TaxID=2316736 RepID=A0A7Y4KEH6_9BACT|nr:hypothetical protein [Corallococcus exercitus]NOK32366.1 hypothetical protein [Corallococcus exercitus]